MFGKDWKGVVNALAGGWQISSIYTYTAASPLLLRDRTILVW